MSKFAIPSTCVVVLLIGCSCNSQRALNDKLFEQAHQEYKAKTARLRSLDNINPLPADQLPLTLKEPAAEQGAVELHLVDLGIVLRKVSFSEAIDSHEELWFSEAEVTNEQFALYLAATRQMRDDTAIERAEEERRKPFHVENSDGSLTEVSSGSTSGPSVQIHSPASLWRSKTFPAGQAQHPVTFLTVGQAFDFCKWLTKRYELKGSFRLPTEPEWLAAAYGADRQYPWGNDDRDWRGASTEPVTARPELRTPDGLFGMWGNVSELILSDSTGYGGKVANREQPMVTKWLGHSYEDQEIAGKHAHPRQDYWGYTHGTDDRSDQWGFRIVFVPEP